MNKKTKTKIEYKKETKESLYGDFTIPSRVTPFLQNKLRKPTKDIEFMLDIKEVLEDLTKKHMVSVKEIATYLEVTRQAVYDMMKLKFKAKADTLDKLKALNLRENSVAMSYFVRALYNFNKMAELPKDYSKKMVWNGLCKQIHRKLGSDKAYKDLVDFTFSNACFKTITSPEEFLKNIPTLFDAYKRYKKVSLDTIADYVAKSFLEDLPKFNKTSMHVLTKDKFLAHTIKDLGGCMVIYSLDADEQYSKFKFTYMKNYKDNSLEDYFIVREGNGRVVTLDDYKENISMGGVDGE